MIAAQKPVLILAGGSGGHIFPGIAVANALRAKQQAVHWLGSSHGLENQLVPKAGIALAVIEVKAIRGKNLQTKILAPLNLFRALWQSICILRALRPACVISFGGFAAGPGGLAAWLMRIPLIVHEQNSVPGVTNRVLAKFAQQVLTAFPKVLARHKSVLCVGNPVRAEIAAIAPPAERAIGSDSNFKVLVLGGSQGARAINQAMPELIGELRKSYNLNVRHQAGASLLAQTNDLYQHKQMQDQAVAFIEDMAGAYAWADLVICRSGALTIAELTAAGVASILIPYPHAVDDHQTSNAMHLVQAGAAILVSEGEGFLQRLSMACAQLLARPSQLLEMANVARSLASVNAAEKIADFCIVEARS